MFTSFEGGWLGGGRGGGVQMEHLSVWKAFALSDSSVKRRTASSLDQSRFQRLWNISVSKRIFLSQARQCGRVVRALDSQSGGPGFGSRSCHLLDLFGYLEFKLSATLVNSQRVASSCKLSFFLSCYVIFELFVSKYLSGVPVN